MVSFVIIDLTLLVLFTLGVIVFLYTRKHNLQRQGIIYLYKTKLGIKFIDAFAKKFRVILRPMQYVVITSGYILMVAISWLIVKTAWIYLRDPLARDLLGNTPPVAPLIPYFPKLFGLESFFPPLYFMYFIIALTIVAVVHEFSHGIFARFHNFKIHSTGFVFLGPILGAFVEPDEKQMAKAKKIPQLSVLGAGTFANVVMTILFALVLWLFFAAAFSPAGVKFDIYSVTETNINDLVIGEVSSIDERYLEVFVGEKKFFVRPEVLDIIRERDGEIVPLIDDSPAFRSQVRGAVTEINRESVTSFEAFDAIIQTYKAGDELTIKTVVTKNGRDSEPEFRSYDVTLAEKNGEVFLGLDRFEIRGKGVIGYFYEKLIIPIKSPQIYYESSIGSFGWFIYYLIWWIVVINILVALFNMLPLGILDGGRFFYLTVWGLTGSEKIGKKAFAYATWALIAILVLMMVSWFLGFF